MPAWLPQLVFSLLLTLLQKKGVLTKTDAFVAKKVDGLSRVVEHIKTFIDPTDYPSGKGK